MGYGHEDWSACFSGLLKCQNPTSDLSSDGLTIYYSCLHTSGYSYGKLLYPIKIVPNSPILTSWEHCIYSKHKRPLSAIADIQEHLVNGHRLFCVPFKYFVRHGQFQFWFTSLSGPVLPEGHYQPQGQQQQYHGLGAIILPPRACHGGYHDLRPVGEAGNLLR